ncbi:MAG: MFS transporter [Caulobacterales bacterium]
MSDAAQSGRAAGLALTLALCFGAAMCEGMDIQAAGVAAGGISQEFRPTPGQLGLFFAAANLGLIAGALFGGRLADRIGRKPVLTASILVFGACSLFTGLAQDMNSLTAARLLTGLGLGGAMPNMIALVADATAERSRNATIATTYIGMPVGGTVASLIVLGLAPAQWRWLFFLGAAAPLAVGLLLTRFLREPSRSPAAPGGRQVAPVSELFRHGRLGRTLVIWAGFFASALTLHLMLNWLPLLLQGRGLSKGDAGLAQVAFNLMGAGGALIAGRLLDTRLRGLGVGLSILAIPLALLLLAEAPAQVAGLALAAGLLGAGVLSVTVILYGVAGDCYPSWIRGTGMGAAVGSTRLGALAGPTLAAVLLGAGRTPAQVLISLLPVVLAAGLCVGWLNRPRRAPRLAAA